MLFCWVNNSITHVSMANAKLKKRELEAKIELLAAMVEKQ